MPTDPVTGEEIPYADGEMQDLAAGGLEGDIPPELLQAFGGLEGPADPAAVIASAGEQLGMQLAQAHAQLDEQAMQVLDMLQQVLAQAAIMGSTIGSPGVDVGVAGGPQFAAGGPAPVGDPGLDLDAMLAQAPPMGALPAEAGAQMPVDPGMIGG